MALITTSLSYPQYWIAPSHFGSAKSSESLGMKTLLHGHSFTVVQLNPYTRTGSFKRVVSPVAPAISVLRAGRAGSDVMHVAVMSAGYGEEMKEVFQSLRQMLVPLSEGSACARGCSG